MFKGFGAIRQTALGFVFLRRIARFLHDIRNKLDRANELKELELQFRYPALMKAWQSSQGRTDRRPLDMSVASYDRWDAGWKEAHSLEPDPDEDE